MHPILERHRQAPVVSLLAALVAAHGGAAADTVATPPADASHPGATTTNADADAADTVVLNAVGDVAYPDGWGGIAWIDDRKEKLFELVAPILDSGDLNFANIECPFTEARAVLEKTYPITCKPERLAYIVNGGFNLLSLANNHSLDAGEQGIADTLALLEQTTTAERPLWWAGVGPTTEDAKTPAVFTPPGKRSRVAMFAVANTSPVTKVASLHDPELPGAIAAAAATADIVIVSVHYGPEYVHVPSESTVGKYHALIDAGADVVVAHHSHVVQGVERYGDGVIFYSLGNFSFGSHTRRHLETGARLYSMIGRITFRAGRVAQVELVPLYANNSYDWTLDDLTLRPRHATPQLLSGAFAAAAMTEFEDFARRIPGGSPTELVRVGDRLFVDLGDGGPAPRTRALALHEQRHDYYLTAVAVGWEPTPATVAEKQVEQRAGTLLRVAPPEPTPHTRARARKAAKTRARKARSQRRNRR